MPYRTASRTASRTGKRSYRPRHPALAARSIQRTWRKSRARAANKRMFSVREVGAPKAATTCKSVIVNNNAPVQRDDKTLYKLDLTQVAQGINIDQRARQHMNVSGFKIFMEIYNTTDVPLYFNCAILAPKFITNADIDTVNFFRNNTDARSMDFNSFRSGLEMGTCNVNTDDYTILKHKRYILTTPNNSVQGEYCRQYGSSFKLIKWWIPLKRQVRYLPGESSTATDGRVFHVFWLSQFLGSGGATPQTVAISSARVITYFREPRN